MRSLTFGLCAVLALLAVPLAAETSSTAPSCPTLTASQVERSLLATTVESTDCYFRPSHGMRIYEYVRRDYGYFLVEYWLQCDGSVTQVRTRMKGGDSTYCWRPTDTPCIGNQDWPPSPLC